LADGLPLIFSRIFIILFTQNAAYNSITVKCSEKFIVYTMLCFWRVIVIGDISFCFCRYYYYCQNIFFWISSYFFLLWISTFCLRFSWIWIPKYSNSEFDEQHSICTLVIRSSFFNSYLENYSFHFFYLKWVVKA